MRAGQWHARLTLVRSYAGLAARWSGSVHGTSAIRAAAIPVQKLARTWIVSVLACGIFTIALVLPPLSDSAMVGRRCPLWRGSFRSLSVPQALPLSIPAGLCVAVLLGGAREGTELSAVVERCLGSLSLFTTVVLGVLEWAVPQGNQSFREMMAARLAGDGVQ